MEPALHQRLEECARQLRLKKYTLGLLAIEAAVEAIEKNNYKLVVPIQFDVAQVPTQVRPADPTETGGVRYPQHKTEVAFAEDVSAKARKAISSSKGISDRSRKKIEDALAQDLKNVPPKGQKAP